MPTISADKTYWVDISTTPATDPTPGDPDFTDGSYISIRPEELSFSHEIRLAGDISFQISFDSLDQDGNIIVTPDFLGPWRSFFRLRYGDIVIMAGPIISVQANLGQDYISVAGKTWEEVFAHWMWPLDPTTPESILLSCMDKTFEGNELIASGSTNPGLAGLYYQCADRDIVLILGDIITNIMNTSSYRLIFDVSTLAGDLSTIHRSLALAIGDTSYLSSIIDDLITTGQGMDWWITWTRKIYWATPFRFGNVGAPDLCFLFDADWLPADVSFTNNGVQSTHILGVGAGLASQKQLHAAYGYPQAERRFTRLDKSYDFGDVRNPKDLKSKTQQQLAKDVNPQHDITMKLYPDQIPNYWTTFLRGRACWIDLDLGYHHLDDGFRLRSYEATVDKQGNAEVNWTLEHLNVPQYPDLYSYSNPPNVGVVEA